MIIWKSMLFSSHFELIETFGVFFRKRYNIRMKSTMCKLCIHYNNWIYICLGFLNIDTLILFLTQFVFVWLTVKHTNFCHSFHKHVNMLYSLLSKHSTASCYQDDVWLHQSFSIEIHKYTRRKNEKQVKCYWDSGFLYIAPLYTRMNDLDNYIIII